MKISKILLGIIIATVLFGIAFTAYSLANNQKVSCEFILKEFYAASKTNPLNELTEPVAKCIEQQ